MPTELPKSFKDVDKQLTWIIETLSKYREESPDELNKFLDDFESLHLESLSLEGEERQIFNTTLLLTWSQMMCILKGNKEE